MCKYLAFSFVVLQSNSTKLHHVRLVSNRDVSHMQNAWRRGEKGPPAEQANGGGTLCRRREMKPKFASSLLDTNL